MVLYKYPTSFINFSSGCFPLASASTVCSKNLTDLFALDSVNSLNETLPTSCFGTFTFKRAISSLVGTPS